jgi:hypothetical protein
VLDLKFADKAGKEKDLTLSESDIALDQFFLHFVRTLITTQRGGKNETFRVGDGFMAAWNLNKIDEKPLSKWEVFLVHLHHLIRNE